MPETLHDMQLSVKAGVALSPNDRRFAPCNALHMSEPTRIHTDKLPIRKHYIREWAERRHLKQADIVREVGADKGTVSRWFSGQLPGDQYLSSLAALFHTDVSGLFKDPDDDWLAEFFRGRSEEERLRIKATLEAAFPKRVA